MKIKNKIILTFNKFYINLIKDLKNTNDDIKNIIKKNYKVVDKLSDEFITFFNNEFGDVDIKSIDNIENIISKYILKDITVKLIFDSVTNSTDQDILLNYIYILLAINIINKEFDQEVKKDKIEVEEDKIDVEEDKADIEEDKVKEGKQLELLLNSVINIISLIQNGDKFEDKLSEIVDDDIKCLLLKIKNFNTNKSEIPESNKNNLPFGNLMDGNSKIANLAKEISDEIDVSNINIDKPEDIMKLMDFTSSNNLIGDIIKKVSTKMNDKISTGEIKQEELFGEAMNMMGMLGKGGGGNAMSDIFKAFSGGDGAGGSGGLSDMMSGLFNNPMMSEVMKAMKKGKAVPKTDVFKKESARERLKAKLAARKAAETNSEAK